MCWYYKGQQFDQTPEDYIGFVYMITEKQTGKKYIGKKLFWKTVKRPPLKGKTRKRTIREQSDWKSYFGSSRQVQENVDKNGHSAYHREILKLCKTKGDCSYWEAKLQFDYDVLRNPQFYNEIINCRINSKHLTMEDSCSDID